MDLSIKIHPSIRQTFRSHTWEPQGCATAPRPAPAPDSCRHQPAPADQHRPPPHCLPAYRASHPASMVLSRILIATPYNDSKTVRRPAPRDHPPAFSRHRLPLAPDTCTTFTRGCMSSGPHSTRSQRLPRACSKFLRGSGLAGRTLWRVMMAHLEFADLSNSVRAMWEDFDATVRGHSGR